MKKRWNILTADQQAVSNLHDAIRINPTLCKILVQRGIDNYDVAKDFFRPQITQLHNPWLMKDMHKAVDRIQRAFKQQESILVYGDYDVDGTTAVASMYHFLKSQYTHVNFYIPHRYREGYGVSKAGIDYARENNYSLIIALDCGIKSIELIAYAESLDIDFIVCDHHLPDDTLPNAVAILNPKQKDCPYPYKELCGCGVGFKLIEALCATLELPQDTPYKYLDLVATAIAADIVPITGENRILAYYGLQKVNNNPNLGIKALIHLSGTKLPLTISNVVFVIAPRVNAAGRMDDAKKAVHLFVADMYETAMAFAEQLHNDNTDRREADANITKEALDIIIEDPALKNRSSTVVYQPHWHKGVVGIVASRLIETYYRPTIVLTESGDYAAGSARSVTGFNLYEAIHACRDLLVGYGGHFAAAGLTLEKQNIDKFSQKFEEIVSKSILPEQLIPEIVIDAAIQLKEITPKLYSLIQQMEPFGPDNMTPVFVAQHVMDTGFSSIVKEKHIKFHIRQGDKEMTGIGFNLADKFHLLENKQPVDIVFKIAENEWNGNTSLQLRVEDIQASGKAASF